MENIEDILVILNEILVKINKIDNEIDNLEKNIKEFQKFYFENLNSRNNGELRNMEQSNNKIVPLTNFTEYDRILINNLESRLCILEEESQKYN